MGHRNTCCRWIDPAHDGCTPSGWPEWLRTGVGETDRFFPSLFLRFCADGLWWNSANVRRWNLVVPAGKIKPFAFLSSRPLSSRKRRGGGDPPTRRRVRPVSVSRKNIHKPVADSGGDPRAVANRVGTRRRRRYLLPFNNDNDNNAYSKLPPRTVGP